MVSPVKSRFLRVPEDMRLLRQFLISNDVKNILYIGGANGEDLLGWFAATIGYKCYWTVSELQLTAETQLRNICDLHNAELFFEDFQTTITRTRFNVIIGNYFLHKGWDTYKRALLQTILSHSAKLVFVRDAITDEYDWNDRVEYIKFVEQHNYDVYEHPEHLDAGIDGCKRRDSGYVWIRNDVTYTADKYTQLQLTREVLDAIK